MITEQWAERLDGTGVVVHAMHPGWVDTEGVRDWMPVFRAITRPIIRTPEQGADTIVWLGAAPEPLAEHRRLLGGSPAPSDPLPLRRGRGPAGGEGGALGGVRAAGGRRRHGGWVTIGQRGRSRAGPFWSPAPVDRVVRGVAAADPARMPARMSASPLLSARALPHGHLPGADARRVRLRRRRRRRGLPARPRASPTSTSRPSSRPAGSTHGYDVVDHAGQPGARRRGGPRRLCAAPWARPAWASSSTSSPTTWPSPGASNAWWWDVLENGPSSIVRRLLRRRLGPARAKLAQHGAAADPRRPLRPRVSRPAGLRIERDGGSFTVRVLRPRLAPLAPRSLDDLLRRPPSGSRGRRRDGGPTEELQSSRRPSAGFRCRRAPTPDASRAPPRQGDPARPPGRGFAGPSPRVGGGDRRRDRGRQRLAGRARRPRSSARTTGWPGGGPPPRSSTTAGSSTSTTWPASGSRTPEVFARHAWARSSTGSPTGVVDGLRVDHVDGLADPAGYLAACAPPRPTAGSSSRRSSSPARSCRRAGRWTGRRATTGWPPSPGCSVDGAGYERHAWPATAPSPARTGLRASSSTRPSSSARRRPARRS